jgi:hypothetical protein
LTTLDLEFFAITAARYVPTHRPGPHTAIRNIGSSPLTMQEVRRLFTTLINTAHLAADHVLQWSLWRRNHQANARSADNRRRTVHKC